MRSKSILVMVIVVFLLWTVSNASTGVIYVDTDANGANDGSSWADAYNFLQDALAYANSDSDVNEIRVAQGIYTPDSNSTDPNGSGGRYATFQLINGVVLRGGYAGFGQPDPDVRDIEVCETILRGDLLSNDGLHFANNGENSYTVVTGSGTDANAVLDGFTIRAGNANNILPYDPSSMGGGMYNNSGSPTVTNCTFIGNSAQEEGGGMCNWNNSSPTVTDCTFIGNTTQGEGGGGMYNYQSSPTVMNCSFSENSARDRGGGMYNRNDSSPTVTDCTFSENSAKYSGGGMYNYSSPTVTNCTFSGNTVQVEGGGMYNSISSSPTVTDCTFSGNTAQVEGGGMSNSGSPTVTDCTFSGNTSWDRGGGMSNSGSLKITNCMFSENSARGMGGGMFNSGSSTITKCTFSGNMTQGEGGGMSNSGSPTVTNCTFSGNTEAWNGGGMSNYGNPTVTNCTFSGNTAQEFGGGMYNIYGSPTVTNCIFIGNSAQECGGGMCNNFGSSPTVTNCSFSGNTADWNGGGMCNDSSSPTVTNCTFSDNTAWDRGGGIFNKSSSPMVTNCILWGGSLEQIYNDGSSSATVSYSDVERGWPGTGNINEDPLFIGPDGLDGITGTADDEEGHMHLRGYSPCINAGDPAGDYGGKVDIDDQPRVAYGRVDMGADEVFPAAGDYEPDGDVDFADFRRVAQNWLLGTQ